MSSLIQPNDYREFLRLAQAARLERDQSAPIGAPLESERQLIRAVGRAYALWAEAPDASADDRRERIEFALVYLAAESTERVAFCASASQAVVRGAAQERLEQLTADAERRYLLAAAAAVKAIDAAGDQMPRALRAKYTTARAEWQTALQERDAFAALIREYSA